MPEYHPIQCSIIHQPNEVESSILMVIGDRIVRKPLTRDIAKVLLKDLADYLADAP